MGYATGYVPIRASPWQLPAILRNSCYRTLARICDYPTPFQQDDPRKIN